MAALLRRGLRRHGHAVDLVASGEDAIGRAHVAAYAAIVLDVALPGIDGLEVCRRLRGEGNGTAVLMLTARDGVFDRVAGLDAGADDYLVKPFAFAELLARLRALHRRGDDARPALLEAGGLRLDPAGRRVSRDGVEIILTATEYVLLEHAWDMAYENRSNVIDVYVRRLRTKIDRPFGTDTIETLRGAGYRLRRGVGV